MSHNRSDRLGVSGHLANSDDANPPMTDPITRTEEQLSCCGWPLDDDGFCHGCWEHCL